MLLLTVSFLGQHSFAQPSSNWTPIFNGKSLDGWKACDFYSPGKVHVEDGALVMSHHPQREKSGWTANWHQRHAGHPKARTNPGNGEIR